MPYQIDETHDPKLESWVESANDPNTDFPIQNLPLVIGDAKYPYDGPRPCVRIGDEYLDLAELAASHLDQPEFANTHPQWRKLDLAHDREANWSPEWRQWVSSLLRADNPALRDNKKLRERCLKRENLEDRDFFLVSEPVLRDYTDFYASLFHATNVGSMFRPDNPLLPNYKHMPIGYHGRTSSIVASGTEIRRPSGQLLPGATIADGDPTFGPCKLLDYELEIGAIIGRGNQLGEPVSINDAEDHILGLCLLNDWSARDMQKWEYQPLGPFLAKSFATTVSPYIVTMEALAPFRTPALSRDPADPTPLPYLMGDDDQAHGGFDITLEVFLASAQMRERGLSPVQLSKGNFKNMYWTIAQMVAHHTSNGCNLQPGDLLGSGTISGPTRDARGCLLELTWDGDPFADPPSVVPGTQRTPIELPTGETRKFLADGDEIIIKGHCEREGFRRIGFGECRGIITPAT